MVLAKMLELVQPTKLQFDFIYGELNTTPEAVRRDVHTLMEWLEKQPHLPNIKGRYRFWCIDS